MKALEYIPINSKRPCKVAGCSRPRFRIGGYCKKHQTRLTSWGSPTHQFISRMKDYAEERKECRKLIQHNLEGGHKGLTYAVDFLDGWLNDASTGDRYRTQAKHFARLRASGVTSVDILTECSAVWLFWDRNPSRIHSLRHWQSVAGNCVIHLTPYGNGRGKHKPLKTSGKERREVGGQIHQTIGTMIVLVARAIRDGERAHEEILKAMHMPLQLAGREEV
jgi:hypothetical protein